MTYLSEHDTKVLCNLVWQYGNKMPPIGERKAFAATFYHSLVSVTENCRRIISCSVQDKNGKWRLLLNRMTLGKKIIQSAVNDLVVEVNTGAQIDLDDFAKRHKLTLGTVQKMYNSL